MPALSMRARVKRLQEPAIGQQVDLGLARAAHTGSIFTQIEPQFNAGSIRRRDQN